MWINTLEYLFPISADDMIRGVVFTDFGTVEPNVTINDFRVAPGFGLRIVVPAMGPAPIALDFAWPIVRADSTDRRSSASPVGSQRYGVGDSTSLLRKFLAQSRCRAHTAQIYVAVTALAWRA